MEASANVTPTTPGDQQPRIQRIAQNLLNTLLVPVLAVFSALVIGGIIIVVTDAAVWAAFRDGGIAEGLAAVWHSVATAYGALFSGALGDANAISESLVASTPYIFAGLAVAVGFRGGLFNIGGEGQLLVAAGVSVVIGYSFDLPAIIHLPLAFLGGVLGGAIY
ncbi:MAG: ABC transporter permease, partial [Chloroflexi bacterium]